jgi:hypothetical protein
MHVKLAQLSEKGFLKTILLYFFYPLSPIKRNSDKQDIQKKNRLTWE